MLTEAMSYLIAVIMGKHEEDVSKSLLELGVLHLVDVTEIKDEWKQKLSSASLPESKGKIEELRRKIEGITRPLGITFKVREGIDLKSFKLKDIETKEEDVEKILARINEVREAQRAIQQEIMKYEDIKRHLEGISLGIDKLALIHDYSFIEIKSGRIDSSKYDELEQELKSYPTVITPIGKKENETNLILIYMKRAKPQIEEILNKVGWREEVIPEEVNNYDYDFLKNIDKKVKELKDKQNRIAKEADDLILQNKDNLQKIWQDLKISELVFEIESYFKKTTKTLVFSGWVPSKKKKDIEKAITETTSGACYIQWLSPQEIEKIEKKKVKVPVALKNPRIFAPFQMLVTNYSIPEYRTVDPTPVVVFTYLIMFGLMFPDVGQGLVIFFLGLLATLFFKKKENKSMYNLSKLMIWCGATATLAGFMFGSVFGLPLLKPIWFNYHAVVLGESSGNRYVRGIFDVIKISVIFGIGVIELGIVFNWINLVIKKRWIDLIFTKSGILGAWIFNGGIYVALYMVHHGYKSMPPFNQLLVLSIIPAFLFIFKKPAEILFEKSDIKEPKHLKITLGGVMNFVMEWVVELLEVFSGYLSNTLSFMRVAGFGIAHVSLMVAFYQLAQMASGGQGYNLLGYLTILFGNVLVIVLEGLSVGVQSLRLNYYEFFSKFFIGSGVLYKPVRLEE